MGCTSGYKFNVSESQYVDNRLVSTPTQVSGSWLSENTDTANTDVIAVGQCFSAAIKTDGTLWLSGYNANGQLGINSTVDQSSPVQTVSGGTNWKTVSLSSGCATAPAVHAAAVKTDGTLWLWGDNSNGQLGTNEITSRSSPVQTVSGGTDWCHVSVNEDTSAAIKTDGTLWLWGNNLAGRLGDGTVVTKSSPVQTVSGGTNWKQVCVGITHTSAVKTDGSLWLWGEANGGLLGTGNNTDRSSPVQTLSAVNTWKQTSLGRQHSAAVKTDGTLWTWGRGDYGILGDNTTSDRNSPVQTVAGGSNWKSVALGLYTSAAIKTDGTLWLWGRGECFVVGSGATINYSSPVQTVSGGTNWKSVSLGGDENTSGPVYKSHALATQSDCTLYAWGDNCIGQQLSPPISLQSATAAKDFDDVFVRKEFFSEGGLWVWGSGTDGRLGTNSTTFRSSPVQTVSGGTNWKQVNLGQCEVFTLRGPSAAAIKTDGTLWLWGDGGSGRLGNNSTADFSSPVQTVSGGTNWKQVSTENVQTAAIKTDGSLWVWGSGTNGGLGTNSTTSRSSPVQTVSGGTNWKEVSVGTDYIASLKTDGTLWVWGSNGRGQLGTNSLINHSSPVQTVSGGTNWKQVSALNGSIAAIKTDGTLWLWGCNTAGQLGNNSSENQSSPVQTVSGGTNWKQVSGGEGSITDYFVAAIKTDGTLWLWGCGSAGRLGNNSSENQSSPVQTVSGGTNWKQVNLGGSHASAIKTDGTLWVWGNNNEGQLGTNSLINESSPVQTVSGGTNWKQVSLGASFSAGIREDCW